MPSASPIKRAIKSFTLLSVLILSIFTHTSAKERESITFTCPIASDQPFFKYAEKIYTKTFDALGYDFQLMPAAPTDIVDILKEGLAEGDCGHIPGFAKAEGLTQYMEMGPPPITLSFGAWSYRPIPSSLKKQLKLPPQLTVGYVTGLAGAEKLIEELKHKKTVPLQTTDLGMQALKNKDIDIWLDRMAEMEQYDYRKRPTYFSIIKSYPILPLLNITYRQKANRISKQLKSELAKLSYADFIRESNTEKASDTIHFNCLLKPDSPLFQKAVSTYREAFSALGKSFFMTTALPGREIANIKSGLVDGSCGRSQNLVNAIGRKDIIIIDVPLANMEYRIWSLNKHLKILSAEDIISQKLSVGYRYGIIDLDDVFKKYPSIEKHRVIHVEQGLKMLAARRVDLFIDGKEPLITASHRITFNQSMYDLGVFLGNISYPILHSKHQDLAIPLTRELNKQKKENAKYLLQ
jgi:ABC-type amino acid transport substrate-binding protein